MMRQYLNKKNVLIGKLVTALNCRSRTAAYLFDPKTDDIIFWGTQSLVTLQWKPSKHETWKPSSDSIVIICVSRVTKDNGSTNMVSNSWCRYTSFYNWRLSRAPNEWRCFISFEHVHAIDGRIDDLSYLFYSSDLFRLCMYNELFLDCFQSFTGLPWL